MPNPWDSLPDANAGGSGKPWDALPDAESSTVDIVDGKVTRNHPSKMTDDEIATRILGLSPQDWAKAKSSGKYKLLSNGGKKQVLADAFTDPEGWWGSYVVGKNKDAPGTSLNRAVQSLFAGGNRALLATKQLVGKVAGSEGDSILDDALLRANEANQNINQGRDAKSGGFDPLNVVGQAVTGSAMSRGGVGGGTGARLAGNAALGATEAALTTPGGNAERGLAATVAGAMAPVVSGGSAAARSLLGKAKGKAYKIGKTPAVTETMDELSARYGGGEQGDAWHKSAMDKWDSGWNKAHAAYAPVDFVGDKQIDITRAMKAIEESLAGGGLSPLHPAQASFFRGVLDRATEAGGQAKLSDVINVLKDFKKGLYSLQKEHGDMIDRNAFEKVVNAFKGSIQDNNPLVAKALSNADAVFAEEVGPLIGNKTLVKLRDKPETAGDLLRSVSQGPLKNVKPQELAATAEGSSSAPIMYQFYENALNQAGGRPGGFVPMARKVMPAMEAMDPQAADTLARQIDVAETSKAGGALVNYLGGKLFGTPAAVVASHNPAVSGPGGVWGALQKPGVRDWLTEFGATPVKTTTADDTLRAMLMAQLFSPDRDIMQ